MIHGQISEYFTVKANIGFENFSHEGGIVHTVEAYSCIDTLDPELTELALAILTVSVGVLQCFFDCVFGYGPDVFLTTEIAFGELQHFFASRLGSHVIY